MSSLGEDCNILEIGMDIFFNTSSQSGVIKLNRVINLNIHLSHHHHTSIPFVSRNTINPQVSVQFPTSLNLTRYRYLRHAPH